MAAETYGMSECSSGRQWVRSLITEARCGRPKRGTQQAQEHSIAIGLIGDAKAVCDHLCSSKPSSAGDKRVSVELSLLRQGIDDENIFVRWMPTTMNLADSFTKSMVAGEAPAIYLRAVLDPCLLMLGPDPRSPPDRRSRSTTMPMAWWRKPQ